MGHFLKIKCAQSPLNLRILSSTSVPLTLTTVQLPNLALNHTERITVCKKELDSGWECGWLPGDCSAHGGQVRSSRHSQGANWTRSWQGQVSYGADRDRSVTVPTGTSQLRGRQKQVSYNTDRDITSSKLGIQSRNWQDKTVKELTLTWR